MGEKRPNPGAAESFKEDEPRKLFVGGLSRSTTADSMKAYFCRFGAVTDVIIMMDPQGVSRGFGFITFDDSHPVDRVMEQSVHFLDSKQVDVKRSVAKHLRPPAKQITMSKKAFLGGLPTDMTEDDLKQELSVHGRVTECNIMYDEKTMKSRGFGFVGFDDDSVVDKLLRQQFIPIRNRQVEVKAARQRINVPVHSTPGGARGQMGANGVQNGPPYEYGYGYAAPAYGYPPQYPQQPYGAYPGYGYPPQAYQAPAAYPPATGYPPAAAPGYGAGYGAPPHYPAAAGGHPTAGDEPAAKRQKQGMGQNVAPSAANYDPASYYAAAYNPAGPPAPTAPVGANYAPGAPVGSAAPAASAYPGYAYAPYPDPSKVNGAPAGAPAPGAPGGYYSQYPGYAPTA